MLPLVATLSRARTSRPLCSTLLVAASLLAGCASKLPTQVERPVSHAVVPDSTGAFAAVTATPPGV